MDLATLPSPTQYCIAVFMTLALQACTATTGSVGSGAEAQQVPELELNLPAPDDCECASGDSVDYNLLDKGFDALVVGEHIEAIRAFQSYQKLEGSPAAQWEAGIAIAYDSMLAQSPFYDPQAAVKSYLQLQKEIPEGVKVHEKILMMRDSLATFVALQQKNSQLQRNNKALSADLEKREEALKRLRELALGQKGATP